MEEKYLAKMIKDKPEGIRSRGHLKLRWIHGVCEDLRKRGIKGSE